MRYTESVATKADVLALKSDFDHKIEIAVRDMTIRTGAMLVVLFGALASIFFG